MIGYINRGNTYKYYRIHTNIYNTHVLLIVFN